MLHCGRSCHRDPGDKEVSKSCRAADCSASAFCWRNVHLIGVLRAAGLQMSPDTNERLVQHANKTAVASPTANRWLCACFLFPQLRLALLRSTLGARKQAFMVELFWRKVAPFSWKRCMPLREHLSLSVICQRSQWSEEDRRRCWMLKFEGSTAKTLHLRANLLM